MAATNGHAAPELDEAALADYEHPISIEGFRKLGYEVVDMICEYMAAPKDRVVPDVQPGFLPPLLPACAPQQPEQFSAIKADFYSTIMKGVMHWQSPRFFSWFAGNTSMPGILAEMLIGGLNMIGFSWQSSPISTELEMVMMSWLAKLCGLPTKFLPDASSPKAPGGVIQSTSSEAVLVAMLAARARAMKGQPHEETLKLVAYGSDQAHSCYKKAAMVLGLQHVRLLHGQPDRDYALDPQHLADAIAEDLQAGLRPFFFMATVGTTSSCAVDPLRELGTICREHGLWMHVDAAWAGSAALLPEQRHWFDGLELVDSYSFSVHKWLLMTFDCAAMWLDDTTYLKEALSLTPVFLRAKGNALDYKDWQIPLGRRFRSLKLWFVLRMYGAEKLQGMLRHHIALGQWFAQQVAADDRFELAAPPRFGLTCFRLAGGNNEANKRLVETVNATGESFIIGTELSGKFTVRFAVGNATTQLKHVQHGWDLVCAQADKLLQERVAVNGTGASA